MDREADFAFNERSRQVQQLSFSIRIKINSYKKYKYIPKPTIK